jgi:hypothetical protein
VACRGDEEFYATANTLGLHQVKDSEERVDKMVQDLEKQYVILFLFLPALFIICFLIELRVYLLSQCSDMSCFFFFWATCKI